MKHLYTFDEFVSEGSVKAFEMSMESLIDFIKNGMGWIDPYYLEDTYFQLQKDGEFFGMPYNSIKQEIYKRLMKSDLLYFSTDDKGEKKGKKITSISSI